MVIDAAFYMRLALKEAWKFQGLTYPNPAVGCTVVGEHGEILAVEAHKKAGRAHAEVLALQSAYVKLTNDIKILELELSSEIHAYLLKNHNGCFSMTKLYVTLEPCSHIGKTPSCASLISKLGIEKIFIGSLDPSKEASGGVKIIEDAGIEVQSKILPQECDTLLEPFVKWREKRFVFFKWAQRLNGTIDDGIISTPKSREFVHAMRDVCDLLVIGGNTVRADRPTLDARLVGGRAPDILIISQRETFDKSIPLFHVQGRRVMIAEDFSLCKEYRNIMIEGAGRMFEFSKDFVDYYLCFLSPQIGGEEEFSAKDRKFKILNMQKKAEDIMLWMKQESSRG